MPQDPPDTEVEGWLKATGIESLCQWDVLLFLDRHRTTLIDAEHLARLLGYATEPLVDALDALEILGLVDRSRLSQGARLYRFIPPSGRPNDEAFRGLLALAGHRSGRLVLSRLLQKGGPRPAAGPQAARRALAATEPAELKVRPGNRRSGEGRGTWLEAI